MSTRKLRAERATLFAEVSALLFQRDPMGINFVSNTDEYDPEAGTILPRLTHCSTPADVQGVLHEEFSRWFGADMEGIPGQEVSQLAQDLWQLWLKSGLGKNPKT
jgi:hypothetical protein